MYHRILLDWVKISTMKALYSLISLLLFSSLTVAQPNIPLPDAPDVSVVWQDDGMHLTVSNLNPVSNNYLESYAEFDSNITEGDSIWYFQGYKIYQVQIPINNFNSHDPDVARLVAQTDINDDIDDLYNSVMDPNLGECVTIVEVEGVNGGLASEFVISSEMWSGEFVEGEFYCYVAMAYVANVNGVNLECAGEPYQFYPGVFSTGGDMIVQCATVPEPTSIIEQFEFIAEIFPNPTTDVLHWDSASLIGSVRILSILGEELLSAQDNAKNIDMSILPSGMYLVEIVSGDQKIVQRVMKQ